MIEMGADYVRYRTERLGVEGDDGPGCKLVFTSPFRKRPKDLARPRRCRPGFFCRSQPRTGNSASG